MVSDRFDPGITPSECPPATHIYGDKIEDNGNGKGLEYYETLEHKLVQFLKKHGSEFGESVVDLAKIANRSYNEVHKVAEESEKLEVIRLSRGDRIRMVRGGAGW